MASNAKLMVEIGANNMKLKSTLSKSQNAVARFARKAGQTLKRIAKVGALAFAGLAAGIAVAMTRAANEIDKLAKTSAKLGVGIENLQRMQFQARLAGVSTETFNMALQRMVRRVAEAGQGTGEAVNALKELGINARFLANLSPDKQFERIAQAMTNIRSRSERVRIAFKLFDSEGVALVNLFNKSLRENGKRFDELKVSVSKGQSEMIEKFNDTKTAAGAIFDGLLNKLTAKLAPGLDEALKKFEEFIKSVGGADAIAEGLAKSFITAAQAITKAFQFLGKVLMAVELQIQTMRLGLQTIADRLSTVDFSNLYKPFGFFKQAKASVSDANQFGPSEGARAISSRINQLVKNIAGGSGSDKFFSGLREGLGSVASSIAPAKSKPGFGSITDASGRTITTTGSASTAGSSAARRQGGMITDAQGNKLEIKVDEQGMIKAFLNGKDVKNTIQGITEGAVNNTARQIRR